MRRTVTHAIVNGDKVRFYDDSWVFPALQLSSMVTYGHFAAVAVLVAAMLVTWLHPETQSLLQGIDELSTWDEERLLKA